MLIHLKNLLTPDEVTQARGLLLADDAPWIEGARSAGGQAVTRKNNQQLAQDSASAATLRELVLAALRRDPVFFSAALPRRIFNPLFNRYEGTSTAPCCTRRPRANRCAATSPAPCSSPTRMNTTAAS